MVVVLCSHEINQLSIKYTPIIVPWGGCTIRAVMVRVLEAQLELGLLLLSPAPSLELDLSLLQLLHHKHHLLLLTA